MDTNTIVKESNISQAEMERIELAKKLGNFQQDKPQAKVIDLDKICLENNWLKFSSREKLAKHLAWKHKYLGRWRGVSYSGVGGWNDEEFCRHSFELKGYTARIPMGALLVAEKFISLQIPNHNLYILDEDLVRPKADPFLVAANGWFNYYYGATGKSEAVTSCILLFGWKDKNS